MKFDNAQEIDSIVYQLRLSDYPRGKNRELINNLFNGWPPYTDQEAQENNISVNVNFLEPTRMAHDARMQFYGAFLKPGKYFTATTDSGPVHHRNERSTIVTSELKRVMKRSLDYYECFRSKFALNVLHGIGPSAWDNTDSWCPQPVAIADVLVPANTLLTMRNLPFFALYHSYTAPEMMKLTRGPKVDPGWNKDLVERCIAWVDRESANLMGSNWPEVWSPEKAAERLKADGGWYVGDQVPTIDVFDFYFYADDGKNSGWRRRMILDAWSTPTSSEAGRYSATRKTDDLFKESNFLYSSGNRNFAQDRKEIVAFQFADLSAVAPFRYHSVRSLGYLLYAVGHLQNRLRCSFNEAVFETLMVYMRIKTQEDFQRALSITLAHKKFIDDNVQFIPASERWQPNAGLAQLGLNENQRIIQEHSSSYTQNQNYSRDRVEKTKFQVMAELNAMTSLVSAAFQQAYTYQEFEYREILRRFFKKNSADPDVREFQAACYRQGIPDNLMVAEKWDLTAERVMGAGNKTMELAIAEQMMQYRPLYDPEPQRDILRIFTNAMAENPGLTESLVPQNPHKVTDAVHDAQLAAGSLMKGLPVGIKTGMNHIEYVETLLADMAIVIQKATQRGNMAKPEDIEGLQNMAQHIAAHIEIIGQDKDQAQRAKEYAGQLGQMMNLVKAFAQRLQQALAQSNGEQGQAGPDPKDIAKIQTETMRAHAKVEQGRKSHAAKTAQRQIQFEQEMRQNAETHAAEMAQKAAETAVALQQKQTESTEE